MYNTVGTSILWTGFSIVLVIMLVIDLLMQKLSKRKLPSIRQDIIWSLVWIAIALISNIVLWAYLLQTTNSTMADSIALDFLAGYFLEKTLSIDNLFVWLMIFNHFSIPTPLQRRLLTWGIIGSIALRLVMVFTSSWIINQCHWLLYLFGIFLIFTGIQMILPTKKKKSITQSNLIRWINRHLLITSILHGEHFFIRSNGLLFATPLLIALIMVECSDIIFSLDSIPAIFAVTTDPFIVLTSNLYASIGLRSMYFLLVNMIQQFSLFKYGLGVILIFIGIKMLSDYIMHIPVMVSLLVITFILIVTFLINIKINRNKRR